MNNDAIVTICAWCDFDKSQTRALAAQGRKVSHTCCQMHRDAMIAEARKMNAERQAQQVGALVNQP